MSDKDLLKDALEAFKVAQEAEEDNRKAGLDDIRFSRMAEQWPEDIKAQREQEGRPCLTINRLPAFIRQVVNDSRQNTPSIKVHPSDSQSDPETAEIINGLIRNIEYTSNADVAYDNALESAVTCGIGYWRVDLDYAFDDSFDKDIVIKPVDNVFSVYGDPYSTSYDSADWNTAFVVDTLTKAQFKAKYKGADNQGLEVGYKDLPTPWGGDDGVQIAEYWYRKEIEKEILLLSDMTVMDAEVYVKNKEVFDALGITVVNQRMTKSKKVHQCIMSGAEILEKNTWAGRYIPIVPVYGDVINVEGVRHLKGLVRDAKDPQRMFNYWRTTSTELVALSPKAPFIGPKGSFNTDADKWATANVKTHAYIEYDGGMPPQRQGFDGPPAGAIQEALNAADDMKSIIGIYDAGLGARSNETSGRAILARQKESDTSTFHFIDNLNRAIRHTGRIMIDLIPHVYTGPRVVRIMGGDDKKTPENVKVNEPMEQENGEVKIYDLTAGKYDLTVESGPSYNTKREEAANQMVELLRAFPQAAPFIGDLLAKNLDWPGAEEISERLKKMLPPQLQENEGANPEVQAMQMQMGQMMEAMKAMQQENQALQNEAKIKEQELMIKAKEAQIKEYQAETDRIEAQTNLVTKQHEALNKDKEIAMQQQQAELAARQPVIQPASKKHKQAVATKQPDGTWQMESVEHSEDGSSIQKLTKAIKSPDGSWVLEAIETPQTLQ